MAGYCAKLLVAVAGLASVARALDVSTCVTRDFAVDVSGDVQETCHGTGLCLVCTIIDWGPGDCDTHMDYLVRCVVSSQDGYPEFPVRLERAELSGVLPGAFDEGFADATALTLGGAQKRIGPLPAGLLGHMRALREVRLVGSFDTLPKDFFGANKQLAVLHIDAPVEVSALPANVVALPSLRRVYLAGWNMGTYDGAVIEKAVDLEILAITGGVTSIAPTALAAHSTLTDVYVMGSPSLSSVPSGFLGGLSKLKWLNLSGNSLRELPANVFSTNTALVNIDLSNNVLESLPQDIFSGLKHVAMISIAGNKLDALPAALLADNANLVEFWANNNSLTALPGGLFNVAKGLKYLNFKNNCVETASKSALEDLPDLTVCMMEPQCGGQRSCAAYSLPATVRCT